MFIGKTHSGKTTFAKEIEKRNKNVIVLEADPIALLMNNQYPRLKKSEDRNFDGSFKKMALKFQVLILFIKTTMLLGKPIILSNSNLWKKGRDRVFKMCKKFNYNVIGVYFDFPEEFLVKRIDKSSRTKSILSTSKDFHDLIIRQRARVQPPNHRDFDQFFTIKSEKDLKITLVKLLKILK
jgi:predicted kinase